jgi:hypothetical protein
MPPLRYCGGPFGFYYLELKRRASIRAIGLPGHSPAN